MPATDLDQWLKSGKYLPEPLRDFHDQKDVFKAMHDLQKPAAPSDAIGGHYSVDFITGQCYVIDRFLWFMAKRGYTLQRSRASLPFRDLAADVDAASARRDASFTSILAASMAAPAPREGG